MPPIEFWNMAPKNGFPKNGFLKFLFMIKFLKPTVNEKNTSDHNGKLSSIVCHS